MTRLQNGSGKPRTQAMGLCLCGLMTVVVGVVSASSSFAQVTSAAFNATFEELTAGGNFPSGTVLPAGPPDGDTITNSRGFTGGNDINVVSGTCSADKAVGIFKPSGFGNAPALFYKVDPNVLKVNKPGVDPDTLYKTGTFVIELQACVQFQFSRFSQLILDDGTADDLKKLGNQVFSMAYACDLNGSNCTIKVTIGGSQGPVTVDTGVPFTAGVPQQLKFVVNLATKRFDFFIDNNPVLANQPFIHSAFTRIRRLVSAITGPPANPNGEGLINDNVRISLVDTDSDGVPDFLDNCPTTYNPNQEDFDHDGIGDFCDLCPKLATSNNLDSDGDGLGDACEDTNNDGKQDYAEALQHDPTPTPPNAPSLVHATFRYNGQASTPGGPAGPITTFRPTCINTLFTGTDSNGNRLGNIYAETMSGPDQFITLQPGDEVSVTCDVATLLQGLTSGAGGQAQHFNITATGGNLTPDPDGNVPLFLGTVTSAPVTVTIEGSPVVQATADVLYIPFEWVAQWATIDGPPISAQISNVSGHPDLSGIDVNSIRLNGTVPIIPGSATLSQNNSVLTVQFKRTLVLASLGTVIPPSAPPGTKVPVSVPVQGTFSGSQQIFVGNGSAIVVKAQPVTIDIKPGSGDAPFGLNPGTVPVAIFGTATFDVHTVNVSTVTLAGAPAVNSSFDEKNGDGIVDLMVFFESCQLQLTVSSTSATLEGKTNSGTPIIGSDGVRISSDNCH